MIRITLRVPDDLYKLLKSVASDSDRSVNSEIVRAIREHVHDTREDLQEVQEIKTSQGVSKKKS